MEYFFYAAKAWLEIQKFDKYIAKSYKNGGYVKICFDDSNYADFTDILDLQSYAAHYEDFTVFGRDGFIYFLTLNGAVKKGKYQKNSVKLSRKSQKSQFKRFIKLSRLNEQVLKKYPSDKIVKTGRGIRGYNKYLYINCNRDFLIPFRFKCAEKKNQPLVVYLGGGGTVGCDNNKLLHEFIYYTNGKHVEKRDCNILLPQIAGGGSFETESRKLFAKNTADLIRELSESYAIDRNRVYVYGTSLGGGSVWNTLLDSPDLFACALEAMGCYFGYESLDESKFKELAEIPIWMAHSSDDTAVDIASDDYFYDKLKEHGADIQYSRWDKYGHKMAYKFYRQEPWIDWMLSHSKER